jgi:hypothetical protein
MKRLALLAAASLYAQDLRWTVNVGTPALSSFQRLILHVTMRIDGKEIADRGGKGEFIFSAEFKDSSSQTYRTQSKVNLAEYSKATAHHELECDVRAFILPGSYELTLSVTDAATKQRSVNRRIINVPPLSNDPLPDLWKGLPAVEFLDIPDTPDRWFLPEDPHRMAFPKPHARNVRLEVIANVSPSEATRRQRRAFDRNMDAIIPALRLLSQIDIEHDLIAVDVSRRQIEFEQHGRGDLAWPSLRRALEENSPNKIDVGALKDRDQSAQFFADQVAKLASGSPDERRVVLVLSAPVAFSSHQEIDSAPPPRNARVIYFRFQTIPPRITFGRAGPELPSAPADDLTRPLKPFQPKILNLYSPTDVRKALASILKELQ